MNKTFFIYNKGQKIDTVWTNEKGTARSVLKIIRHEYGIEIGDKFKAVLQSLPN